MNVSNIIQLYNNNESVYQIAKRYNVSRKKIQRILDKNNVKKHKSKKRTDIDNRSTEIVNDFINGQSILTISKKHNCSRKVIERILKENNVDKRTQSEAQKTKRKNYYNSFKLSPLNNDFSIENIQKTFNVCKQTAINIRKLHNITDHIGHKPLPIDTITELNHGKKMTATEIAKIYNVNYGTVIKQLNKSGVGFKNNHYSALEKELENFLIKENIEYVKNTRTLIPPLEIDFYLPNHNLAIELNGIYWHSELQGKNKQYHVNKTNRCEELNIQLLHFWDSEWLCKQEIVESMILSKVGKTRRIHARKCVKQPISSKEANEFIISNHIQGQCGSKEQYGLFYESDLVAVMTFGLSRFKKGEYELLRYCSKTGVTVVGGASRLLSCVQKPLVTYANRRYSNGNMYSKLGFKKTHISLPNYFYTRDYKTIVSRHKFQKHKIQNCDKNLTEWENMQIQGYDRIWDCGNIVFKKC